MFLSPRGNVLYRMMSVFNVVPPEGSKVTAIQCLFFSACRLRAVIPPDSLNLLMILWIVDDEIPKFLVIVR